MIKVNLPKLLLWILIALLPGILGSLFTMDSIPTWYAELNKPSFNPPNWIFGPVWTTLYILIGISGYIYTQSTDKLKLLPLSIFFVQLALNNLWSFAFFGLQDIALGLKIILLLDIAVIANILLFNKKSKLAAALLIPYLAWILFATILNYNILILN